MSLGIERDLTSKSRFEKDVPSRRWHCVRKCGASIRQNIVNNIGLNEGPSGSATFGACTGVKGLQVGNEIFIQRVDPTSVRCLDRWDGIAPDQIERLLFVSFKSLGQFVRKFEPDVDARLHRYSRLFRKRFQDRFAQCAAPASSPGHHDQLLRFKRRVGGQGVPRATCVRDRTRSAFFPNRRCRRGATSWRECP